MIIDLRIYIKWIKPYLKAAQKLGMKEFNTPDIVASFNNMQIQLSLFPLMAPYIDIIGKALI